MTKFTKTGLAAALLAAFTYLPLHANAALFDDEEARKAITDLRARVEAMRVEVGTRLDNKSDKTSTLELVNQHEQVMSELANLRGRLEVLTNDLAGALKRQKDLYVDMDARIRKLEPRAVTIDGKQSVVDQTEQKAYDAALLLFKAGDYKAAAQALTDFVRVYPESAYAANAQYWLGNTFYAQKDCKGAILAQHVVVKAYPESARAADAMLNIAVCQDELKAAPNARKTLTDLITKYPDSDAAVVARDRLKKK